MSVLSKVLAGINLLVAAVLLMLAGQSLYARNNWSKHIDQLERDREGLPTEDLVGKTALDPERSLYAQRLETSEKLYEPVKEKPVTSEAEEVAKKVGPDEYKRQVSEQIRIDQPKLLHEERALMEKKALLLGLKDRYQVQIDRLTAEIKELEERRTTEQELQKKVQAEIGQRQRDIAQTYAELEEALASRRLAEGKQSDMQSYLEGVRRRAKQLAEQNQKLAGEIETRELGR